MSCNCRGGPDCCVYTLRLSNIQKCYFRNGKEIRKRKRKKNLKTKWHTALHKDFVVASQRLYQ